MAHGEETAIREMVADAERHQNDIDRFIPLHRDHDIRFVRPDVAIVSCTKHVSDQREASSEDVAPAVPSTGSLTYVVVKEHDAWRIALAQTTPVRDS